MQDRPEWVEPDEEDWPLQEAEALLQGHFLGYATRRGRPIPAWAWVNQVAHASPGELKAVAAAAGRHGRQGQPLSDWREVQAAAARELLWAAGAEPDAVARLQRHALVPLELALLRSAARGEVPVTPQVLGRLCHAALRAFPSLGWPHA